MKKRIADDFYFLAVKGICNTNCSFCNFFEQKQKPIYTTHLQELKTEVDEVYNQGYTKICIGVDGYEPTMFPYFEDIIIYLKDRGFYVSLNSNGVLFSSEVFAGRMSKYIDKLNITLYSSNNKEHFLYTQKKQSYRVKHKAIENCLKYGIEVQASILLLKTNIYNLRKIIDDTRNYWTDKHFTQNINLIEPSCQMGKTRNTGLVPQYGIVIDILYKLSLDDIPPHIKIQLISSIPVCISSKLKNPHISMQFSGSFALALGFISVCDTCQYKKDCKGIDMPYLDAFGEDEFISPHDNINKESYSEESVYNALTKAKEEIVGY